METMQISLAAARVNAGFTQNEVAKKLKVNKQTIINWEKNRSIPKPAYFEMLCNMYGVGRDNIRLPKNIT